jgi:hypothetical protein
MAARGFLGSGDLLISVVNPTTQVAGPLQGPFECSKFEIKTSAEQKTLTSRSKATYGQAFETVSVANPSEIEVVLDEVNANAMAMVLAAVRTDVSQGSGTWSDAPLTVNAKDAWFHLGKYNVAEAGFTLENVAGTTAYVMGVDYIIDYQAGMLKILATSTLNPSTASPVNLSVNGSYAAFSGSLLRGAASSEIRVSFQMNGQNYIDKRACIVRAPEGVLNSDSGFDFKADEFGNITLKGILKVPNGATEPFTVLYEN